MLGLTVLHRQRHFYFELSWFWCRQTFQKVFWRSWTRPSSFLFSKKEEGQALMHILVSFSFDIGRAGSKRPISYCKLSRFFGLFPLLKLVQPRLAFTRKNIFTQWKTDFTLDTTLPLNKETITTSKDKGKQLQKIEFQS